MGNRKSGSCGRSEEWVCDLEVSEALTVLEVLSVETIAPRLESTGYDQRVVPGKPALGVEMQCLRIQYLGRMDSEQRVKDRAQILISLRWLHRLGEPPQGHIEEFLDDLIADDSLLRRQRVANDLCGFSGFDGVALVEGIDKDVRVQKESIVHSIRLCRSDGLH